ncbi:hypothetical protein NDA01_21750 [Trichocoleus desertorum AS-A10]|uniref:hypothetical protein n=1 Tax=Trichocoleus desertorum TaxID=1481672 RepID=UPI003299326A
MKCKVKRSSDRPIPVKGRPTQPNLTTAPTVSVPQHLRQLQQLQPLSDMTCYEAEFVRSAIAHPNQLSQGEISTVAEIHKKHLGSSTPKPAKKLNNRLFRPQPAAIAKLGQLDKAALDLYSYLAFYCEPGEYYTQLPTWLEAELQSGQHDEAISTLQTQGLLEVEAVRGAA